MGWIIWTAVWTSLCYWLAKSKNASIKKWLILGFLFGPFAFGFLALKKKADSAPIGSSIKEQATESLRTIRYSVDNVSSKINESGIAKTGGMIGNMINKSGSAKSGNKIGMMIKNFLNRF